MTRQDREFAITDNVAYVTKCIDAVRAEWPTLPKVVFAGFSQGVAMAFRAAVNTSPGVIAGVISVGGDVPPEITPSELTRVSAALIARGSGDPLYGKEKFTDDERRLRESSVRLQILEFNGGHEWSNELVEAASRFLRERHPSPV